MVQDNSATEVGKLLGNAIQGANLYKDDFIETEDVTNLDIYFLETVQVSPSVIVTALYLSGSAMVLDHPVYGILDTPSLLLSGEYAANLAYFPLTFPIILGIQGSVLYSGTGD